MKELAAKLKQLTEKVEEMRKVIFANIVDWDQLVSISLNETVMIDGTFNTKLYEDNCCIIFKTIIPPKGIFPYHLHDFLEQDLVIKGELEDLSKKYKKNDWMVYEPYVGHEVKNTSDKPASIIVIFTK